MLIRELTNIYPQEIDSALQSLAKISKEAQRSIPSGSLELRYHRLHLPDTALLFETAEGKFLTWDLSFGKSLPDKRIFVLEISGSNLGVSLASRYQSIWKLHEDATKFKLNRGRVEVDELRIT